MIYEVRNHWFVLNDGRKLELTNLEHEFLMALKFGTLVTYDELAKSIYNCDYEHVSETIRVLKYRFIKKTKFNILSVEGKGYILRTNILVR